MEFSASVRIVIGHRHQRSAKPSAHTLSIILSIMWRGFLTFRMVSGLFFGFLNVCHKSIVQFLVSLVGLGAAWTGQNGWMC